jgi:hypothetical protein
MSAWWSVPRLESRAVRAIAHQGQPHLIVRRGLNARIAPMEGAAELKAG